MRQQTRGFVGAPSVSICWRGDPCDAAVGLYAHASLEETWDGEAT